MDELSGRDVLKHPLTVASAAVTTIAGLFQFGPVDALFAVTWTNAQALFTLSSIGTFVASEVDALPEKHIVVAAVVFAVLYAAQVGWTVLRDYMERLDND